MLIDAKTLRKIERIERQYLALRFEEVVEVPMEFHETTEHLRRVPEAADGGAWQPAPRETRWGDDGVTAWFRGEVSLPQACEGRRVFVRALTGGESLFVVDEAYQGVFDENHPVVLLTLHGVAGKTHTLAIEAYAGHTFPGTQPEEARPPVEPGSRTFEGVSLMLEREDVSAFVFDLMALRQLAQALDVNSLRKYELSKGLVRIFEIVNAVPSETPEEVWRSKLAEAREVMQPLLESKNAATAPEFALIGHSHLDTAWLWSLDESIRKAARTFSSILNLMDQYPEFVFLQSAPCHTEMVRQEYPSLFERIRERVREGRWEPNGGMWVEPDCNIPSGEALVRQLLLGQTYTREWFGYTSDTLWMPDVFGYSAALPQILKGCNIDFFCTTKIGWNDTTRFPYDTFEWKGIDGSSVITHYNAIHCWPDPETLIDQWNWVQHKDAQQGRICAYGFGDGGGGPMAEMIEIARRVADLEGCPRARHMTVSDFMGGLNEQDLPAWAGELYLEGHRGTLTSIAAVKRGNRKAEFAMRDAEFLCTLVALQGNVYPREALLDLWKTLLTRQFHDILPGTSIAVVNDEAIEAFASVVQGAGQLGSRALQTLGGEALDTVERLLVVNTLSWEREGAIVLEGVPNGLHPQDQGILSQWIEGPDGNARLAVQGLSVPGLGARTLVLGEAPGVAGSPFVVSENTIETPYATVAWDTAGRIVSFRVKPSGREIVRPGGALNVFLLGEDVPENWDTWDIDSDQGLKMRESTALVEWSVVANGPLQLRVRQTRTIGAGSVLTQDIVFHAASPRVDFETVLNWSEKRKLLKVRFDLDILADFARHEIQYGHAERPVHRNLLQDRARFEVCAHKWTDLSENGFGVAILDDSKYGVSVFGGEIGLTLVKSGVHPDPRGDAGQHEFVYALLPHDEPFSVPAVVRPAYELNVPPVAVPAGAGVQGWEGLVSVDAPNVIVESVKMAETGHAFVVRLYEAGKTGCPVRLGVNSLVKSAYETNLLEENPQPLAITDGGIDFWMRAFEIKTLRLEVG
jgi:alpha-mannosidase